MEARPAMWALVCCCVASVEFLSEEQAEVIGRPTGRAGALQSCGRLMLGWMMPVKGWSGHGGTKCSEAADRCIPLSLPSRCAGEV